MALVRCRCRLCALEAGHAHDSELLAMTLLATVVLAALLLEHEDLPRLLVTHDLAEHAKAFNDRLPDLDAAAGRREQHLGEREIGARLAVELLEPHRLARGHSVLFP